MLPWILCIVLAAAVLLLLIKLHLLQKSFDEIRQGLGERLSADTNTLISISSGDKHARQLASEINNELRELRRLRGQYQSGDRELKDAVTNISHDLRTPLTAICGYLDLLEQEEKSESVARYLSLISNRADALKQLTEEFFRYSIILSTGDGLRMQRTSVNAVLEESLAAHYPALTQRGIVPEIEMPETQVMCLLDPAATARVFGNIINNAIKYSDGDLTVRLFEGGTVKFENTARALDKVQVGRLFDRFFTIEAARNSTGLGLAISKTLVEQMGGTISAQYSENKLSIRVSFPPA